MPWLREIQALPLFPSAVQKEAPEQKKTSRRRREALKNRFISLYWLPCLFFLPVFYGHKGQGALRLHSDQTQDREEEADQAAQDSVEEAVDKGLAQDLAFASYDADCGTADGDALGAEHLSYAAAHLIGRAQPGGIRSDLLGRLGLQGTEENGRGGAGACYEAADDAVYTVIGINFTKAAFLFFDFNNLFTIP